MLRFGRSENGAIELQFVWVHKCCRVRGGVPMLHGPSIATSKGPAGYTFTLCSCLSGDVVRKYYRYLTGQLKGRFVLLVGSIVTLLRLATYVVVP